MKEKLLALLEENKGTITEAVINEILDEKKPLQRLLDFDAWEVEWWLVKCLTFEKDCIKFFNKHYKEIEHIKKHLSLYGQSTEVPEWYSIKMYYSIVAFKFIAFELYMKITIEDLL